MRNFELLILTAPLAVAHEDKGGVAVLAAALCDGGMPPYSQQLLVLEELSGTQMPGIAYKMIS